MSRPGRSPHEIGLDDLSRMQLDAHFVRTDVILHVDGAETSRTTLGWFSGRALRRTYAELRELADLHFACRPQLLAAATWRDTVVAAESRHRSHSVWLPREEVDRLLAAKPDWNRWREIPETLIGPRELEALDFLGVDPRERADELNQLILRDNLQELAPFFGRYESSPLTDEQSRAVVCMDNRVLVVAAAGSGETSVMVARAAYAVKKGLVDPQRILLLAFNASAAAELGERVKQRFDAAGLSDAGVAARTFHAFGLQLIGSTTGRKPRAAPWLEKWEVTH